MSLRLAGRHSGRTVRHVAIQARCLFDPSPDRRSAMLMKWPIPVAAHRVEPALRIIAQLSGSESRHPGAGQREARVRQGCGPCQQPCREQPSAHAGARAAHARLSRPEAHAGFPVELRSDPSALRTETTSAARFSLSQTPYGPVRRMARVYQRHPNSVDCFLSHSALCINIDEVPQVDNAPDATKESLRALPEFKYAPD